MTFEGDNLRAMLGPGVYLLYRGSELRYVGASAFGMARCLSHWHHTLAEELHHPLARLEWEPASSAQAAFLTEEGLIEQHQPPLNATKRSLRARQRRQQRTCSPRVEYARLSSQEQAEIKKRLNL